MIVTLQLLYLLPISSGKLDRQLRSDNGPSRQMGKGSRESCNVRRPNDAPSRAKPRPCGGGNLSAGALKVFSPGIDDTEDIEFIVTAAVHWRSSYMI